MSALARPPLARLASSCKGAKSAFPSWCVRPLAGAYRWPHFRPYTPSWPDALVRGTTCVSRRGSPAMLGSSEGGERGLARAKPGASSFLSRVPAPASRPSPISVFKLSSSNSPCTRARMSFVKCKSCVASLCKILYNVS